MDIHEMKRSDVIDSRDVIARIEELEELTDISAEELTPGTAGEHEDNMWELGLLKTFAEQCEGYADDWEHGEIIISTDYFTDYIRELIDDCYPKPGGFDENAWPWRHMQLDYDAAACEAQVDYTQVELNGRYFFIR